MRILIGCECSGVTRRAFAAAGHFVVSCDLKPAEDGAESIDLVGCDPAWRFESPTGFHYQGDLFDILAFRFHWDLVVVHPPCTFLSVSGLHWNDRGRGWEQTEAALAFAERVWALRLQVGAMALENPVGILSTRSNLGRATQYIQPYEFGDDASKKTGLWLSHLPPLVKDPAQRVAGRWVTGPSGKPVERWSNQTDSGQNKLAPSAERAAERAVTYPGWARAMVEQWTDPKRVNVGSFYG